MGKQSEPLTESYFYILLCLYGGDNHGYGIMQMTESLSGGRVKIGSGTMYGATSNAHVPADRRGTAGVSGRIPTHFGTDRKCENRNRRNHVKTERRF